MVAFLDYDKTVGEQSANRDLRSFNVPNRSGDLDKAVSVFVCQAQHSLLVFGERIVARHLTRIEGARLGQCSGMTPERAG